mmetsp:Transcript_40254/g.54764  ORF Transcript_40254/g.54764 Transcript_40254/m.54764 type:complete len:96 (+) Transcript_40254:196-483(+)
MSTMLLVKMNGMTKSVEHPRNSTSNFAFDGLNGRSFGATAEYEPTLDFIKVKFLENYAAFGIFRQKETFDIIYQINVALEKKLDKNSPLVRRMHL